MPWSPPFESLTVGMTRGVSVFSDDGRAVTTG